MIGESIISVYKCAMFHKYLGLPEGTFKSTKRTEAVSTGGYWPDLKTSNKNSRF